MKELIDFLEKTGSTAGWEDSSVRQLIDATEFDDLAVKKALSDNDVEQLTSLADARTNIVCMIQVPKEDDVVIQELQISRCA